MAADESYFSIRLFYGTDYHDKTENKINKVYPLSRFSFDENLIRIDLDGFSFNRTDEEAFKHDYRLYNLKQLNKNSFSTSLSRVFVSCEGLLKNEVYLPYLKEFLNHQNQDSISISKKDLHSKGFITFIRNCSRKVRLFFYYDIIKID